MTYNLNMDQTWNTIPQRKRRRPALACERCRQRKIKCDRNMPCGQCIRTDCEPCTYVPDDRVTKIHRLDPRHTSRPGPSESSRAGIQLETPSGSDSNARASIQTSAQLQLRLPAPSQPLPQAHPQPPTPAVSVTGTCSMDMNMDLSTLDLDVNSFSHLLVESDIDPQLPIVMTAPDAGSGGEELYPSSMVQAIMQRMQHLEARLSETRIHAVTVSGPTASNTTPTQKSSRTPKRAQSQQLSAPEEGNFKGTFVKSRFYAQNHWRASISQFDKVLSVYQQAQSNENSEMAILLTKCKKLSKLIKSQAPLHQPILRDFGDYVLPRNMTNQLVQAYLRTFEHIYRVLHVPTFQQEYKAYWADPQAADMKFVIKLMLVCAIGACFHPDFARVNANSLRAMVPQWIQMAQRWLSSPSEKSRINMTGIQIHCLALLARQVNAIESDVVSLSAGSLLRTAIHMGLHRDPAQLSGASYFHIEMSRRLWATVAEIVVQSSMDSGTPPLLSSDNFDCQPPSNIDDSQFDEDSTSMPVEKPMDVFTQTTVQVILAKSLPLRLRIANKMHDFRSNLCYENVISFGSELTAMCRSNDLLFRNFRNDQQKKPTTFHRRVLVLLTHRLILQLHHPFAIEAKKDPTYYYSRKVGLECSMFLLASGADQDSDSTHSSCSSMDNAAYNSETHGDDYSRLKLLGGGPFRDVPLHATIVVGLELLNQFEEGSSSFAFVPSTQTRKVFQQMIEDHVELTFERLRAGETNVKGHALFSAILAQVKAIQSNKSVENSILTASIQSLKNCYRLLRSTLGEGSTKNNAVLISPPLIDNSIADSAKATGNNIHVPSSSRDSIVVRNKEPDIEDMSPPDTEWTDLDQGTGLSMNMSETWMFSDFLTADDDGGDFLNLKF